MENQHKYLNIQDTGQNTYKLDFKTTLEVFFFNVFSFCLTFTILLSIVVFLKKSEIAYISELTLIFLILTLIAWVLHKLTDNYYLIDLDKGAVYYHFKFLFMEKLIKRTATADVLGVSTDSNLIVRRSGTYYKYAAHLLTKSGKKIRISDWVGLPNPDEFKTYSEEVREFAENLKLSFKPGVFKQKIVLKKTEQGQYEVTFEKWNRWVEIVKNILFTLVSLALIIAIFAYILFHFIR